MHELHHGVGHDPILDAAGLGGDEDVIGEISSDTEDDAGDDESPTDLVSFAVDPVRQKDLWGEPDEEWRKDHEQWTPGQAANFGYD